MVSPSRDSLASDSASDGDLAVWMAEYGPGLKRYFSRRAGADQADDLVQEVFLRLRARGGDDPVDNVEGYLPPRARAAFLFHRFDNMTYQAIAERMGIGKRSVKELMQRAIDRLSDQMEREP